MEDCEAVLINAYNARKSWLDATREVVRDHPENTHLLVALFWAEHYVTAALDALDEYYAKEFGDGRIPPPSS